MLPQEKRIRTKAQLKDWLNCELPRYPIGKLGRFLGIGEMAVLRKHQILLRKAEYYTNIGNLLLGGFYRMRLFALQTKHSLHIPMNCCAKGLRIVHLGPVLINGKAVLGEYCALHINTAIVAGGTNDLAPVLGKRVVVGVGAVILGGVQIADYVAVGANAVVNKDVPEQGVAVAGVPAKKISNNGSQEWNKKAKMSCTDADK